MIERIKGEIAFHCDLHGCHDGIETGEKDFAEAKATAQAEGWQFRRRDEAWKHFCCSAHEGMDFRGQSLVKT